MMESLDERQDEPTIIHEVKESCSIFAKGEGIFLTSKRINLRYHYLRENVESNEINMEYICTNDQLADLLNNSLGSNRLKNE